MMVVEGGGSDGPTGLLEAVRSKHLSAGTNGDIQSALNALKDTAASDVSVAEVSQNGAAGLIDENVKNLCIGTCGKSIENLGKQQVAICCYLCSQHICNKCAFMTKAEAVKFGSERPDWHWTCTSCLEKVGGGEIDPKTISMESVQVKLITEQVVPQLITKIEQSMNTLNANITKQWSSLFGENDFPAYDPKISERQAKDLANEAIAEGVAKNAGREGILAGTLKKVQKECNREIADQELRKRTVIVYRVPEKNEKDNRKRKDADMKEIEELLKFIEAPSKPQKSGRVGNFVAPKDDEEPKSRPLKLVFSSHVEAKKVVDSAPKLKNADVTMKSYSIDFDASKEQRDEIRKLVAEAKERSKEDPNVVFRVRGPPWNPQLKEFANTK